MVSEQKRHIHKSIRNTQALNSTDIQSLTTEHKTKTQTPGHPYTHKHHLHIWSEGRSGGPRTSGFTDPSSRLPSGPAGTHGLISARRAPMLLKVSTAELRFLVVMATFSSAPLPPRRHLTPEELVTRNDGSPVVTVSRGIV